MKENNILYVAELTKEMKEDFEKSYRKNYGLSTKKELIFLFSTLAKDLGKDYLNTVDQSIFRNRGTQRFQVRYEGFEAEYMEEVKKELGIRRNSDFLKYLVYLVINHEKIKNVF